MGKPPGVAVEMGPKGPGFRVTRPTPLQNRIWDAVQDAVLSGWSVEQFRAECAEAWGEALRDMQKDAERSWK